MLRTIKHTFIAAALAVFSTLALANAPLRIGYSDWPGWVAWQVGIDQGWFDEAGVPVDFQWFDYSASMDAFAAGQLDAVAMTNGDTLIAGSSGARALMILINDYSNGNDMVVAKPEITSMADLKGKTVAVEKGFVDHLLLLTALKNAGMQPSDMNLVFAKTNEMPQMLQQPEIAAIAAWQPVAGQALNSVSGAHAIFTSADQPGLIYDTLAVNPQSAFERKEDWVKVLQVWDRIVAYINDPATHDEAVKIMAARVGVDPAEYEAFLKGTKLMPLSESVAMYEKGEGFDSLYGSSEIVNGFNVENEIYPQPEAVDTYIDASFTKAALQ